ncbi:MAG: sigma-70 family RNA polymerase sigma factor [Planctomycetota bacterium]
MLFQSVERAFRRFQATGDPKALAFVFDRTVPDLQGLAQHLATPELGAEDLLQSTFLTAIESKQDFDARQPLLPWLAGILANHARAARRRERRELDPVRLRSELGIDPSEEASRAELFATLDAAIARLPENYRAVLRLHLQHGLEPMEIARSLERSPGTVRAQLSRGLDRLRRLLPCSLAAPRAFAFVSAPQVAAIRASLLGRCGAPQAVIAGGAIFSGALIMTLNKKLVAIAALVVAALLFIALREDPGSRAQQARLDPHDSVAIESPGATPDSSISGSADRQAVTPTQESLASSSELPATGTLRVHVVNSHGAPMTDVGVALKLREARQDLVAQPEFKPADANGVVIFEALSPTWYCVESDRGGFEFAKVVAGLELDIAINLLGSNVSGFVVDEQGSPVANATLWRDGHQCVEGLRVGKTNARGEFHIEECYGSFLQARKPGSAASKALPILHDNRGRSELRLILGSEASEVAGRIVDLDGNPLAGVVVAFQLEPENSKPIDEQAAQSRPVHVRSGAGGNFRCDEVPRGRVLVAAISNDPERVPTSKIIDVGTSLLRVELQLGRGATLEGRITDGGAPVERCTIVVRCLKSEMPMSRLFYSLGMRFEQTDGDGRYRIKGIIPGEVDVRADLRFTSHEGGRSGFHQRTVGEGQIVAWDFDCDAAQSSPFLIEIEPHRPHGVSGRWQVEVYGGGASNSESAIAFTDESGQARFDRLPEGHYTLTVHYCYVPPELIGPATLPMLKREFDTSEHHLSLQIPAELLRLQAVHGRLVDSDGKGLNVRVLRLQTDVFPEPARLRTTTNGRGEFAFGALPAGRYTIELVEGDTVKSIGEFNVVGDRAEELGDIVVVP